MMAIPPMATGYSRAAYEAVCEGHVCWETTTALFIAEELLNSKDRLREALVVGLGVDPTGGRYPNGHPDDWKFSPK